jgi:hypothetical protein
VETTLPQRGRLVKAQALVLMRPKYRVGLVDYKLATIGNPIELHCNFALVANFALKFVEMRGARQSTPANGRVINDVRLTDSKRPTLEKNKTKNKKGLPRWIRMCRCEHVFRQSLVFEHSEDFV